MSKTKAQDAEQRRSFIKGAAVATAAVGSGALAANALAEDTSTDTKKPQKMGYQETDHVRDYYRLARF